MILFLSNDIISLYIGRIGLNRRNYMHRQNDERGVDNMLATIKPIQATPELNGEDAKRLIKEVNRKPSKEAIEKNKMLLNILEQIIEE